MTADLTTTNILLGVMAAVSVLQGLVAIVLLLAGVLLFRGLLRAAERLEEEQLSPALTRVNAILDDVRDMTASVRAKTGLIDRLTTLIVRILRRRPWSNGHAPAGPAAKPI